MDNFIEYVEVDTIGEGVQLYALEVLCWCILMFILSALFLYLLKFLIFRNLN